MTGDDLIKTEKDDLKLREELQSKLQAAIRRSASAAEINRIEIEIQKLNEKLAKRQNWTK